jgi:hypothetical protein
LNGGGAGRFWFNGWAWSVARTTRPIAVIGIGTEIACQSTGIRITLAGILPTTCVSVRMCTSCTWEGKTQASGIEATCS